MARYELIEGVPLDLTEQQAYVLDYVVRSAQEDPDFFHRMVGQSDRNVTNVFRASLAQIRHKLDVVKATSRSA